MLQDELTKLTLTELEKKDERQDAERVCRCLSYRLTSFWFFLWWSECFYFFSASTAWFFFLFFFFSLSLSLFYIFSKSFLSLPPFLSAILTIVGTSMHCESRSLRKRRDIHGIWKRKVKRDFFPRVKSKNGCRRQKLAVKIRLRLIS